MNISEFWRRNRQSGLSARHIRRLLNEVERYERIFKGSRGYGFLDWDVRANHMFWDGGFWEYLDYDGRDMKRISSPDSFLEFVHPEDREMLQNAIARHLKMNGPGDALFRIRRKHGGYVWAEVRVEAIRDDTGKVLYTSGLIFDVTKQKDVEGALMLSEARHSRIIKASNDGIWEWTAEHGGFHFSSRCWEQIGFGDGDDVINDGVDRLEAWRSRIHNDDLVLFDKTLNDHFIKKSPFDVEYRILGKDREWRWIRARGQMHYAADGKPWRMSGTNMDITELKRAEERVLKAKEDAEKANRAKSDFLSSMSHELRTPLNAILGFSQLFDLDTNLTPDQRENIQEIYKAGEHLLGLVGDVLDLAKIEAGRLSIGLEPVDPKLMLRDCVNLIQTQADARGLEIKYRFTTESGCRVLADRRRLKQVLLNLLSNAVKYNAENGAIRIDCEYSDHGQARIAISDTGRGIPTTLQDSVFQPFNRLDAENSNVEGTGVGLVISKRLVEQMGGAMGFHSIEREGSTFWLQLPVAEAGMHADVGALVREPDVAPVPSPSAGPAPLGLDFTGDRKILYVEDSLPNQRLMRQVLQRFPQIHLAVVGDGFSGLFEARTLQPDLIIMDINLPGMNGFETLNILK